MTNFFRVLSTQHIVPIRSTPRQYLSTKHHKSRDTHFHKPKSCHRKHNEHYLQRPIIIYRSKVFLYAFPRSNATNMGYAKIYYVWPLATPTQQTTRSSVILTMLWWHSHLSWLRLLVCMRWRNSIHQPPKETANSLLYSICLISHYTALSDG